MAVSCVFKKLLDIFFSAVFAQICLNFIIFVFFREILSQTLWLMLLLIFNIVASVTIYCLGNKRADFQRPSSEDNTQAIDESPAEEDKPPEYEKVIEKAPPYECVIMEDAYRTRSTNNERHMITVTNINECSVGATSHELLDPDLPTYEEAERLMKPKD